MQILAYGHENSANDYFLEKSNDFQNYSPLRQHDSAEPAICSDRSPTDDHVLLIKVVGAQGVSPLNCRRALASTCSWETNRDVELES